MENTTTKNKKIYLGGIVLILLMWHFVSFFYSPLIIPSPIATARAVFHIIKYQNCISNILISFGRLVCAILSAVILGVILGIFSGLNHKVRDMFFPFFSIIQSAPPISWLALAMIWFGINGKTTIFITIISCFPMIFINIIAGIENLDWKLVEMGKIYKFSNYKILREIIMPALQSYFKSGLNAAIGLGWKVIIMGEVLSANSGIGSEITDARLNIETDKVLAWSGIVVVLCAFTQNLNKKLFEYIGNRRKKV